MYLDKLLMRLSQIDKLTNVLENFKETQITNFKVGQNAKFKPDSFPNLKFDATIDSLSPTTGAEFAILPSQNATGNWVKVVQRVPVRLKINSKNIEQFLPKKDELMTYLGRDSFPPTYPHSETGFIGFNLCIFNKSGR